MRRRKSLVTQRDGSSNFYENFSVNGRRFRGSLDTDDREQAEILAAKIRADALLGKATGKKPELTLSLALGKYLLEHGQFLKSADDIRRMGSVLLAHLGKQTLLTDITGPMLATFAARRRASLSNRSVNIELQHLRAVIRRADDLWEVATPKINWQKLMLQEAGEREKILSVEEEARLFAALRPDHHPMVRFALITGLRVSNVLMLEWKQVDWDAGVIAFRVKSKRPEGELRYIPITPAVKAILSVERDRHQRRVFTYQCDRNRHDPHTGFIQRKGIRYPYTKTGWRKEWKKALLAAGIEDFRFHDLRHTAGTRALRAHGNLATVQKMLMHQDITTTRRYAHSDLTDVAAAMEAVELTQIRHSQQGENEKTG